MKRIILNLLIKTPIILNLLIKTPKKSRQYYAVGVIERVL